VKTPLSQSVGLLLGLLGLMLPSGCYWLRQDPPSPSVAASFPEPSLQVNQPSPPRPSTLPALARQAIREYLSTGAVLDPPELLAAWQKQQGVFVTLSLGGQMRGCWGSLTPTAANLAQATIQAAIGAATRDPRYPPLRLTELEQVRIQVALIESVTPVADLQGLDPTRFGLWIRSGGQGAVLLPGEALTTQWQLSRAKALAGIPPAAPVELFRVTATMIHEF